MPRRSRHVQVIADNVFAGQVPYAGTYLKRLRGLLFGGEQVILDPCSSVHGFGMRKSLDVAYIGTDGTVIDVSVLRPWRAHKPRKGAAAAWEAPQGHFTEIGILPGSRLRFALP